MQTWEQDFVSTFGYPHRRPVPVRYAPAVRLWRQKARTGILGGQPLKFLFSHNVLVNIMGFQSSENAMIIVVDLFYC
jgi:hypothetical protein